MGKLRETVCFETVDVSRGEAEIYTNIQRNDKLKRTIYENT